MKNYFVVVFFLMVSIANAQITGKITDDKKESLFGVSVVLLNQSDSLLVKAAVTDDNGLFQMDVKKNGTYLIKAFMVGYETYYSSPIVYSGSKTELPSITFSPTSKSLQEVSISGIKPMIEIKPDKTVFNVENSINATGSTAYELLQKSPGVVVDQNDNIMLKGRGGVMVQIDGKNTQMSGSDLAELLKSMQSTDVNSIELISNPSSKYDAEGTAGIINIKLKKNKDFGTNGSLTAGYAVGIFSKYNTGITLNNRSKGVNLFLNYSNNWGNRRNYIDILRIQNEVKYDQQSATYRSGLNNNYKAGADFTLSKKSTAGVMINGNYSDVAFNTRSITEITNVPGNELSSILTSGSENKNRNYNYNVNGNYRFADTSGHELTIDIDYGYFNSDRSSYQPNTYYFSDNNTESRYYRNITPSEINIYSFKTDYSTPLAGGVVSTGIKSAYVESDNAFRFYNIEENTDIYDSIRSNQFIYKETIYAAYLNYQFSYRDLEFQAGVRSEYTISEGDLNSIQTTVDENVKRDYLDFFPSAGITWKINKTNTLGLVYSSRIDRPNYQDLNPFEWRLDELSYRKGNPFLNPQYSHKIEITHSYNYAISTSASYSRTDDYFAQVTDTIEGNKSFMTSKNLANEEVLSLNINVTTQIKKWWSIYTNIGVTNLHYTADFGGGRIIDASALNLNIYGQQTFKLPAGFSFEISGWFGTPSIWGGTFRTKSQGSLDAGLQKKLLGDKMTLKVSVTDIFVTAPWRSKSVFEVADITASGGWETRQFRANLTWRFGNKGVKSIRSRSTGNETETKRVGGGE